MLARTPLNITSQVHFLSCLLVNSNNVIKYVSAVSECYDNCQLLQPVHEFVEIFAVIQPTDVNHWHFAIPLTASNISQIRSHPVCHLQKLHFPLQLYALPSSTNTVLCGPLYMPLRMWQNVITDWQTFNVTVSKYIATNRRIIILCLVLKQTVEVH